MVVMTAMDPGKTGSARNGDVQFRKGFHFRKYARGGVQQGKEQGGPRAFSLSLIHILIRIIHGWGCHLVAAGTQGRCRGIFEQFQFSGVFPSCLLYTSRCV